jgi:hypothetical protein
MTEVLSYEDAVKDIRGQRHVLLGNGFSIACDKVFKYESLYEAAVKAGLSERATKIFERLGTNNFEGAMRLLDDSHWVAETYELIPRGDSAMLEDLEIIKKTLVDAVANAHLHNTSCVADKRKAKALAFLYPYQNIFTTNYDLLPYWVNMSGLANPEDGKPLTPKWGDGFRSDPDDPDAEYVIFTERLGQNAGLFYLHGALHLYVADGELRKHCWNRTGTALTDLIRDGLKSKQYPVFVAEGSPDKKLEQVQRSGYLWYCLDKFSRIASPLVLFGHSLGASDQHIANAIADNDGLSRVIVGLHGDPGSKSNEEIIAAAQKMQARRSERKRGKGKPLQVTYYQSESATVWD